MCVCVCVCVCSSHSVHFIGSLQLMELVIQRPVILVPAMIAMATLVNSAATTSKPAAVAVRRKMIFSTCSEFTLCVSTFYPQYNNV